MGLSWMSDGAWEAEPGGGNGIVVVPSEESASAPVTSDNDAETAHRRIANSPDDRARIGSAYIHEGGGRPRSSPDPPGCMCGRGCGRSQVH